MKYKIGVFGSAVDNPVAIAAAKRLGAELTKHKDLIIITGGGPGLPYLVASRASKKGVEIWGFSPEINLKHHKIAHPDNDPSVFAKLLFVPTYYRKLFFWQKNDQFACERFARLNYRNVISTANCDGAILISGRWGTLNEFINLYEMGKVIGVLTHTGGIADELKSLISKVPKKSNAVVLFDHDPKRLIGKVLGSLNR
jgi:predicted Rossmann-fold nucleotide-binding protein